MYVCVCVRVLVRVYVCVCVCVHTWYSEHESHTHTPTYTHTHVNTHVYMHIHIYTYVHILVHVSVYMHMYIRMYLYICTPTQKCRSAKRNMRGKRKGLCCLDWKGKWGKKNCPRPVRVCVCMWVCVFVYTRVITNARCCFCSFTLLSCSCFVSESAYSIRTLSKYIM